MHVLIAETDLPTRQQIELLAKSEPDFQIVGNCSNGYELNRELRRQPIDLLLLDPDLPGLTPQGTRGVPSPLIVLLISNKEAIPQAPPHTDAFATLVKPVDQNQFQRIVRCARLYLSRTLDRITVKSGGRICILDAAAVDWIEAEHNHVIIHTATGSRRMRTKLADMEQNLDPNRFRRVHRSAIVNIERIEQVRPRLRGDYLIVLKNGCRVNMSRTYKHEIAGLPCLILPGPKRDE